MKTPRITDFDPDAKAPTLKSSLDAMPAIEKSRPTRSATGHLAPLTKPNAEVRQASPTPTPNPASHPPKRSYVRRTFDFYEDQITYLTRESLHSKLDGKEVSMNEMVRQALDDWINKNNSSR
jgi:hypothetical protein